MSVEVGQVWEYRAGGQRIDVYLVVTGQPTSGEPRFHLVDLRSREQFLSVYVWPSDDPDNSWWRVT